MKHTALLRRGDVLLLRAAARPFAAQSAAGWPAVDDIDECRTWLASVWADPGFAKAIRATSPPLVAAVDKVLRGGAPDKQVRKATQSTARYLLRATGRPTPFGLFAGVARVRCGPAQARFGTRHRVVAAADAAWFDTVRRDLHSRPDVLPHLTLQTSNVTVRHGDELRRTLSGGQSARLRLTRPLEAALAMAAGPVPYAEIADRLTIMGGSPEQVARIVLGALDAGFLLSDLSAPMTETDALGHLLEVLEPKAPLLAVDTIRRLGELREVHRLLDEHAQASAATADALRDTADAQMTAITPASRTKLSVGLALDATVHVPDAVLDEAVRAADVLLRLTRTRHMLPEWASFHSMFWERYGAGTLVPVKDAIDLAAGSGLPSSFPNSLAADPLPRILPRDEVLATWALEATVGQAPEIELTDADVATLATDDDHPATPHADLGVRLYAPNTEAVDRGDYTLSVHPAWSTGCFTGRFAALLPDSGLPDVYASLPTVTEGALTAQLSFTPVHPHAQNVARIPTHLPYVISVDEHRAPSESVIPVDDLAVMSTGARLVLVSISRRRIVEPVVLHALALEKQAPPLARFLVQVGRASSTVWTKFDWGPVADALPYLPRVRYRRAILTPARWRLPASALPAGPCTPAWRQALTEWAKTWACPPVVHLREGTRTLALDLDVPLHQQLLHGHLLRHRHVDLLEVLDADSGWIGHAHEIVMPLSSTRPPLPHPDLSRAPLVANRGLPVAGDPAQPWVQAHLTTHPSVMDQVLTRRLPLLLAELGDPLYWFARYRSAQEADHLRIRVAVRGPEAHASAIRALSAWAGHLQADALASELTVGAYRPEWGRYGTGDTLAAAEAVFAADSHVVRLTLTHLHNSDPRVLCALGMLNLAHGLLGPTAGTAWMADAPAPRTGVPAVTRETVQLVRVRALLFDTPPLAQAVLARRTALAAYRTGLDDTQTDRVLESLLHMHHNRLLGPDRDSEAVCRYAARQAAHSLRHQAGTP